MAWLGCRWGLQLRQLPAWHEARQSVPASKAAALASQGKAAKQRDAALAQGCQADKTVAAVGGAERGARSCCQPVTAAACGAPHQQAQRCWLSASRAARIGAGSVGRAHHASSWLARRRSSSLKRGTSAKVGRWADGCGAAS